MSNKNQKSLSEFEHLIGQLSLKENRSEPQRMASPVKRALRQKLLDEYETETLSPKGIWQLWRFAGGVAGLMLVTVAVIGFGMAISQARTNGSGKVPENNPIMSEVETAVSTPTMLPETTPETLTQPATAEMIDLPFELGGQAFGTPYDRMSYAGMSWIKREHKWSPGNSGTDVAGLISEAHNAGFKILLSIPGANLYPSSIDFNAYVDFLGQVAALPDPPDAIEIWNEQNIDREWPVGSIDPSAYVTQMLAPAYNAIKSANSSVMVVSGAPAPTGFFGGCSGNGCDDADYMAAMAAAGAASYMDCIGVHYNAGILSPNQTSGDPRSEHYTRYFWGMVDTYYNAFGGSRQLCFTELGYLTSEDYGDLPDGFDWASNVTVAQQAQWLAEAASLSANSGKVRMMIVWNIDSTTWNDNPQAGYAIIRPDGNCAACETLRQAIVSAPFPPLENVQVISAKQFSRTTVTDPITFEITLKVTLDSVDEAILKLFYTNPDWQDGSEGQRPVVHMIGGDQVVSKDDNVVTVTAVLDPTEMAANVATNTPILMTQLGTLDHDKPWQSSFKTSILSEFNNVQFDLQSLDSIEYYFEDQETIDP